MAGLWGLQLNIGFVASFEDACVLVGLNCNAMEEWLEWKIVHQIKSIKIMITKRRGQVRIGGQSWKGHILGKNLSSIKYYHLFSYLFL